MRWAPVVVAKFARWAVFLMLSLTLGLQWAALQTIAWATMFSGHLRSEAVSVAFQKTFDGQHPCQICDFVAQGRATERKHGPGLPPAKLEPVPLATTVIALFPPSAGDACVWFLPEAEPCSSPPPHPPPRAA